MNSREQEAHRLYKASWDLADNGDFIEALRSIEQAIELVPRSLYWVTRAQFLQDIGRLEDAEAAAKKAIDLGPRNFHAWSLLGILKSNLHDYEQAAMCFEKSVSIKPDHNVYTLLASVQAEFDEEASARSARMALELEPGWEEAEEILTALKERGASTKNIGTRSGTSNS